MNKKRIALFLAIVMLLANGISAYAQAGDIAAIAKQEKSEEKEPINEPVTDVVPETDLLINDVNYNNDIQNFNLQTDNKSVEESSNDFIPYIGDKPKEDTGLDVNKDTEATTLQSEPENKTISFFGGNEEVLESNENVEKNGSGIYSTVTGSAITLSYDEFSAGHQVSGDWQSPAVINFTPEEKGSYVFYTNDTAMYTCGWCYEATPIMSGDTSSGIYGVVNLERGEEYSFNTYGETTNHTYTVYLKKMTEIDGLSATQTVSFEKGLKITSNQNETKYLNMQIGNGTDIYTVFVNGRKVNLNSDGKYEFVLSGSGSISIFKPDSSAQDIEITVEEDTILDIGDIGNSYQLSTNLNGYGSGLWFKFSINESSKYLFSTNKLSSLSVYKYNDTSKELDYVAINLDINASRFTDLLEEGTYYCNVISSGSEGVDYLNISQYSESDYENNKNISYNYGTVVNYKCSESGIYKIQVTGTEGQYVVDMGDTYKINKASEKYFEKDQTISLYIVSENTQANVSISISKSNEKLEISNPKKLTMNEQEYSRTYSFTPSESGYYNLFSTGNDEDISELSLQCTTKNEGGTYYVFGTHVSYIDDYNFNCIEYLEKDKIYYMTFNNHGYNNVDMDINICLVPNEELVWNESKAYINSENQKIKLYKAVLLSFTNKEKGFYKIDVNGPSESYIVTLNGESFHVYKGIGKIVYLTGDNKDYGLRIANEQLNSSGEDVAVEVTNQNVLEKLTIDATDEASTSGKIENAEDVLWYEFEPTETGYYDFTSMVNPNPDDLSVNNSLYYSEDNGLSWVSAISVEISQQRNTVYKLTGGVKYYYKVELEDFTETTDNIDIKLYKLSTIDVSDTLEADSEQYEKGVVYSYTAKNAGIYNLKVSASKDVCISGEGLEFNDVNTASMYFGTNITREVVVLNSLLEGTNNISFKVSASDINETLNLNEFKEVNISTKGDVYWVKFVPSESGYYTLYSESTKDKRDTCVTLYEKKSDEKIEFISSDDDGGDENNFKLRASLEAGKEYYYKTRLYSGNATGSYKICLYKIQTGDLTFNTNNNITFNKEYLGKMSIEPDDKVAMYKMSINNGSDSEKYMVEINEVTKYIDNNTSTYISGDTLFDEDEIDISSSVDITITKSSIVEGSLDFKIEKVDKVPTKLSFRQDKQINCNNDYSEVFEFTPEVNGYYTFLINNITEDTNIDKDLYIYLGNSKIYCVSKEWDYNSLKFMYNLKAGETYNLYVESTDKKDYKIRATNYSDLHVFDYEEYTAFIASGGTVNIVNEITEEIYDEYNDGNMYYYYVSPNKYILVSNIGFKNQSGKWLLDDAVSVNVEPDNTSYNDLYNEMSGEKYYIDGYKTKLKYFCNTNGSKLNYSTKLTDANSYILGVFGPEKVIVRKVTLTGTQALKIGQTVQLTANTSTLSVLPPDIAGVNWSSSNTNVATVDSNGKVTGKGVGTVTITATSKDGNASASLKLTVATNVIYVSKVTISGKNSVNVGSKIKLSAATSTNGQGNPTVAGVNWSSSNTSIATIDASGNVTGKKPGKVTITAVSKDGKASATYAVTVTEVKATKIKLNHKSLLMKKGTSFSKIKVTISPNNVTNKKITWTSSNKKVATVTSSGKIKAVKAGTAVITAKTSNGKKASVKIKVTTADVKVTKVKVSGSKTLVKGKKISLKSEVTPVTATNQKLTWKSSNTKIATVNSKGVVTGKKAGKVTITATAKDGSKKKASIKITVKENVKKVVISGAKKVKAGKKITLKAKVTPSTASNKKVTWKSSNTKIATVNSKGVVTGKKAGKVTITATAKDGSGKKASIKITVTK